MSLLGIIIPVYNEAENIGRTIEAVTQKISTPHRIYVVYDFAEDNTLPVVEELMSKGLDIKLVRNPSKGVAGAIKAGLKDAAEECLLVTMADMSDDYSVVDRMCGLMKEGYDVVCGSRYMKGGSQIGGPLVKRTLSRLACISLKYLANLPTHDVTNSFKLYRKESLRFIDIESDGGFEIGMEIVVKAHSQGMRITEIPCVWTNREVGESKFKIVKWTPKYLKWYFYALHTRFIGR